MVLLTFRTQCKRCANLELRIEDLELWRAKAHETLLSLAGAIHGARGGRPRKQEEPEITEPMALSQWEAMKNGKR